MLSTLNSTMNKCIVCGGELIDTLSSEYQREKVLEFDPVSAIGRRLAAGLCWVCHRLRLNAGREVNVSE